MSLETDTTLSVRSATAIPSFCNSPWIRGAPHGGFAAAKRETRALIAALTGGRPPRGPPESLVQCARKRRRCYRSTVSGVTITRVSLHSVHRRDNQAQKSRSLRCNLGRLAIRLYTASWWRKARFSKGELAVAAAEEREES